MDGIDVLAILSRWIHLLSALVAVGGAAFMRFALAPGAKAALGSEEHDRLREEVRRRWALVLHSAIVLLLVTGFLNFYWLALRTGIPAMPYHALFGIKFLLALLVFFIATALTGRAPGLDGMRRQAKRWLSWLLMAAALIILLSATLGEVRRAALRPSATVSGPEAATSP